MSIRPLLVLAILLGYAVPAWAENIYRKGCENPLPTVQLCWEAIAEEESMVSPYEEVHLLPIMQAGPNPQPLVDLTRAVYRQLMPGDFSRQLIQEWEPQAHYLDEAMEISRRTGWLVLWISPRAMRNGSSVTSGLVEWDAYLISPAKYRPERTLRLRVEGKPKPGKDNRTERGMVTYLGLKTIGALTELTMPQTAVVVGAAAAQGDNNPPQQGQSMDILTELAVRQMIFLAQYDIAAINPPRDPAAEAAAMATRTSGTSLARVGSSDIPTE